MSKYQKVKIDKIAHGIAIKARNQHIREAAKFRVSAENIQHIGDDDYDGGDKEAAIAKLRADADAKEALAREWDSKARRMLHPVTEDQLLAMLRLLSGDHIEQVMGYEWTVHWDGARPVDVLADHPEIDSDMIVWHYNQCVDIINAGIDAELQAIAAMQNEAGPAPEVTG